MEQSIEIVIQLRFLWNKDAFHSRYIGFQTFCHCPSLKYKISDGETEITIAATLENCIKNYKWNLKNC
jgi:hypothetical protein